MIATIICLIATPVVVAIVQAIEDRKIRMRADGTYGLRR